MIVDDIAKGVGGTVNDDVGKRSVMMLVRGELSL